MVGEDYDPIQIGANMIFFGTVVCAFLVGLILALILMGGSRLEEICKLKNEIESLRWEANWEARKKKEGKDAVPPPPRIHHEVSW